MLIYSIAGASCMTVYDLVLPNEKGILFRESAIQNAGALKAQTDLQAIQAWLQRVNNPETLRSYKKEVIRFLMWLQYKNLSIRSCSIEDAQEYKTFLKNPQPQSVWCGPARKKTDDWKPFVKGLKDSSIRQAMVILQDLFNFLCLGHYIATNVFDPKFTGVKQVRASIQTARHLPRDAYAWLKDWLKMLPIDRRTARWRFIVEFGLMTGLRIHELAKARLGDFFYEAVSGQLMWFIMVSGKGGKVAPVAIPDMSVVSEYLVFRGLGPTPKTGDQTPLIPGLRGDGNITPAAISEEIRKLRNKASDFINDQLLNATPEKAQQLRNWAMLLEHFSTHWLRHGHATVTIADGVPLHIVQQNMRHGSMDTTLMYSHTEFIERWKALQDIFNAL